MQTKKKRDLAVFFFLMLLARSTGNLLIFAGLFVFASVILVFAFLPDTNLLRFLLLGGLVVPGWFLLRLAHAIDRSIRESYNQEEKDRE